MATSQSVTNDTHPPNEEKIKHLHEKLLYSTTAIEFLHPSIRKGIPFQRFRANCRLHLEDPLSRSLEKPEDILEELESKGIVSIGNYSALKSILSFDKKLVREVHRVEMAIACHGGNLSRGPSNNGLDTELALKLHIGEEINGLDKQAAKRIEGYFKDIASHGKKLLMDGKDELYREHTRRWRVFNARAIEIVQIIRYFHKGVMSDITEIAILSLGRCKTLLFKENDEFYTFQSSLDDTIKAVVEASNVCSFLEGKGATPCGTLVGSMHMFISFEDIRLLDSFMKEYENGILLYLMRFALEDCSLSHPTFSFDLKIEEENAERYRRYLRSSKEEIRSVTSGSFVGRLASQYDPGCPEDTKYQEQESLLDKLQREPTIPTTPSIIHRRRTSDSSFEKRRCILTISDWIDSNDGHYFRNVGYLLDDADDDLSPMRTWRGFAASKLELDQDEITAIARHTKRDTDEKHFVTLLPIMKAVGLTVGDIVEYYSKAESRRKDVLDLLFAFHTECPFCNQFERPSWPMHTKRVQEYNF